MPRSKRTFDEMELPMEPGPTQEQTDTLHKLRNMVEFASFAQYIFLFGEIVLRKVDADMDIEDLESECLKPEPSDKLSEIGLALLKYVSSHRGLTLEIFDEYTRRQYTAKAPHRNPYGEEEEPNRFKDFDVFTKIKVLHQLSIWTFFNADRIRGLMPQEDDQLNWRMEPLGWDREDRAYYVLDDNRLYRRSDEPIPPPTPKAKPKKKPPPKNRSRATRASKRRKIEDTPEPEESEMNGLIQDDKDGVDLPNGDDKQEAEEAGCGFSNKTWECVAITLDEYQEFLASIFRTKDPNEKVLRKQIEENVLPIIERREEVQRQKQVKKMRELENLQKMASAKRSSRLADKAEKEKQDRLDREAEERRSAELKMAREEQERQRKIEEGHESRRLTREQRLKEREVKRILHEEELARLEEEAMRAESQETASDGPEGSKRISNRQLQSQREQHKKELEKIAEDEEKWIFDCAVCGMHGENMDDGTHSVACERCNVWQHSKCHGFSPKQVESDEFHFVCESCKRKEEEAKKPKIAPLKLGKMRTSASPQADNKVAARPNSRDAQMSKGSGLPPFVQRPLDGVRGPPPPSQRAGSSGQLTNGPSFPPQRQAPSSSGYPYPPVSNFAPRAQNQQLPPQTYHQPIARAPAQGYTSSPPSANGYAPPPPHYQQHQFIHHNATAAAGVHQMPQQQYPQQTNGYYQMPQTPSQPSRAPYQAFANPPPSETRGSLQQNVHQPSRQGPQHTTVQAQQQIQRPTSGHHVNGFRSSVSPGNSAPQPVSQLPRPAQSSPFSQSPQISFPPPSGSFNPQNTQSPVKSSAALGSQPPRSQESSTHWQQTPQSLRPMPENGLPHGTLQVSSSPQPASKNDVAADGMAGPWPAAAKVIPEKHDQSPVPPADSHGTADKRVLPPVAAFAPSPSQQASASHGTVPVKKIM